MSLINLIGFSETELLFGGIPFWKLEMQAPPTLLASGKQMTLM